MKRARQQLGDRESDRAWADGLAMSPEQAIDEAFDERACTSSVALPDRPAVQTPATAPNGALTPSPGRTSLTRLPDGTLVEPLTERQREVAALVARGLTNRQIGEALVITEGTANLHVKHILRKLGFATRTQIAAWVTRQGLTALVAVASAQG